MSICLRKKTKFEMIDEVDVGYAMSYRSGSDSYGYWIAEVDRENCVIGVYTPEHKFVHSWTDGEMEAADFDANRKADIYFIAFRGRWYRYNPIAKKRFEACHLYKSDYPNFYRDPSF